MDIDLELAFVSHPDNSTDDDFERFLESILDELAKIGRDDIAVTASLTARTASFTVFEGDAEPSVDDFLAAVRTALHAANCGTPGWENARMRLAAEADIVRGELVDV